MELLRERLVECSWRDEMKALCRAYARKKGRNNVTVDDLIHVITPKGRGTFHLVMLHCVIIAQLMLDFTIRKQKRNLDINDNTHVHHVKPETSDWVISNGAQREQIPLCHCGSVRMVFKGTRTGHVL
ncbi:unnamed protein product [Miscanthus lutarioriparius]|uniref:Enhancer of yellow 2 transcription factor homolog n=1 Tax=Miscanthus lutarioriparius TaxID=422564 RepID=A0A811P6R7_9POAL|nr:unnamed protein product [Miscanthus lutarioriparius]